MAKLQKKGSAYRMRQENALTQRISELKHLKLLSDDTKFEKKVLKPKYRNCKPSDFYRMKRDGVQLHNVVEITVQQKIKRAEQDIANLKNKLG